VYDADRHGQSGDERNSIELAAAVASIAATRALLPVYQPIFSLTTGEVIGHEALVRPGPDSGFVDAEALFAAAEATGRTVELDTACIEVVAAAAGVLQADQYLAVNLSPGPSRRTIQRHGARRHLHPSRHRAVEPVLELTGARPSRTSSDCGSTSGLPEHRHADRRRRRRGRQRRARLLSQITFDLVKVDLSLVQGGVLRESSWPSCARSGLAERSSATIVAEGIETAHQLEVVRDLGLAAGQGYLLGRPARGLATEAVDIDGLIARDRERQREVLGTRTTDQVA
jgi:EAL domain-containing protein (putative c-di-GMP-specific phosphodiesterase class I)